MAAAPTLDLTSAEAWPTPTTCSSAPTRCTPLPSSASPSSNEETKVRSHFAIELCLNLPLSLLVIMPESALHELSRIHTSYPMTFMISNPAMGKKTYCGSLEFTAQENMCHIPIWMMEHLCLDEGADVIIRNVNLKKGTYIKFQPHKTEFVDIPNFKEM